MIKRIKKLREQYGEWEIREVHFDFGLYEITANNYTVYIFVPCMFILIGIGLIIF